MKLDPVVKNEAQAVFAELGITLGEAVNLFLNQVRLRKAIPFDIEIPNSYTQQIMNEIREGVNVEEFSLDELKKRAKDAKA